MSVLERGAEESFFEYHARLVRAKMERELPETTYAELAELIYGKQLAEDEARKRFYGQYQTLQYMDADESKQAANRILALSDFHIPFHLPLSTFERYAGRVDTLVLNGDIVDAQSISKFTKLYRIDLVDELVTAHQFIIELVELLRPKHLYITVGNHEKRLGSILANKIGPEIMGCFPDNPLDLLVKDGFRKRDRRFGTEIWYEPLQTIFEDSGPEIHYDGNWFCKVGNTLFAHPQAYSSAMLKTTEKAVNYFLRVDRDFDTVVLGHTHKLGSFMQGGVRMYEQGCCCDLTQLDYANGRLVIPNQAGFLYMCHDAGGAMIEDKTKLVSL